MLLPKTYTVPTYLAVSADEMEIQPLGRYEVSRINRQTEPRKNVLVP